MPADPACFAPPRAPIHQRAAGSVHVAFKRRGGASVLDDLRQEGCLKVRFPRTGPGAAPEAVLLNTSGGVAGGDRLAIAVRAGDGTRAIVTAQAAERYYRALPGSIAGVATRIEVGADADLCWLPQETILFDGCALARRLDVDLAPDAAFIGVESLVFGRAAMGERVREARIDDLIAIRRGGTPILHDRIRLDGAVADALARPAMAAGAAAVATLVQVSPEAERNLDPLRAALAACDAGASSWNGMLVARIVAENGACLRRAVVAALHVLRAGRPLPRVWNC